MEPQVLCLTLSRWRQLADGVRTYAHTAAPEEVLLFGQSSYQIASIVVHLGASPDEGHYLTLAKHNSLWHAYDDSTRRGATKAEAQTSAKYDKMPMKSYVVLYERQA